MSPQNNGHSHTNDVPGSLCRVRAGKHSDHVDPTREYDGSGETKERVGLWPGMIFALLGMNVVIVGITMYAATSDRSFAIEPGYYDKAMRWDERAAAQQASDRLGWKARLRVRGADDAVAGSMPKLSIVLCDGESAPIENAALSGEMFHHARSSERFGIEFHAIGGGEYVALAPIERTGVWQVRLQARRDGEVFVLERSLLIGAMGAGSTP